MNKTLLIILIIVVLGAGGFFVWQNWIKSGPIVNNQSQGNGQVDSGETANWKTYTNSKYGFEIKYPKNWNIKEEVKQYADTDSIKEKYRLDIFYPEDITKASIYGSVAVEFFVPKDKNKFFEQQLDIMKKDTTLAIEEITINSVKGVEGVSYLEADKAKSMQISRLFLDPKNQGVFRILAWTVASGKTVYQEQAKLILSSFKFTK